VWSTEKAPHDRHDGYNDGRPHHRIVSQTGGLAGAPERVQTHGTTFRSPIIFPPIREVVFPGTLVCPPGRLRMNDKWPEIAPRS